jgi:hypothetical protein
MQKELQLNRLPTFSQRATIVEICTRLWQHDAVVALWLGGSLAHEAGDVFSDIDFRVAVAPHDLPTWKTPPFEEIFARSPVVGQQFLAFGEQAFLHHLVITNGEIIDFFVQSTQQRLTPELRLILGCRDEDFAHLLVANQQRARVEAAAEVEPATVQHVLTAFWINTHKHRKVLHRNLDLMVTFGFDVEKALLVRLWYMEASGKDCGDVRQGTIHTLTSIIRTLEQATRGEVRSIIGVPMRTRAEIYHAVESNRNVISDIGRRLAQKYGFVYPTDLEATVLQGWQEFLARE